MNERLCVHSSSAEFNAPLGREHSRPGEGGCPARFPRVSSGLEAEACRRTDLGERARRDSRSAAEAGPRTAAALRELAAAARGFRAPRLAGRGRVSSSCPGGITDESDVSQRHRRKAYALSGDATAVGSSVRPALDLPAGETVLQRMFPDLAQPRCALRDDISWCKTPDAGQSLPPPPNPS
jgi:hypothetical protein